jgi:zinc protease
MPSVGALAPRRALPLLAALSLVSASAEARAGTSLQVPYEMFKLDNGLTVILHEDHALPLVAVNVWYHVGSGSESPGRTGFAHLFEHIMFEGSAHVPEGSFDRWLEAAGGVNNGSTTEDRTNYYEEVPSGALDLALFLESDRMGFLLDTMSPERVDGQRDVVKNERRQRIDNRPYGLADDKLPSLLYPKGHPYSWSVIGSMEDLSAATHEDVRRFFTRFYAPGNASLVIAGDIDKKAARAAAEKWFADVPAAAVPAPKKPTDVTLAADVREVMHDNVQLEKQINAWPTVHLFHEDDAALDVVADVLGSGKSSRLHKRLVYEMQAAQSVTVYHSSMKLSGYFEIDVVARPGQKLEELQKVVDEEIARLAKEGPTERELARSRNQLEARYLKRMESVGARADLLNLYYFHRGEPDSFAWDLGRYSKLSADDVKRVTTRYLDKPRVFIRVLPKGGQP